MFQRTQSQVKTRAQEEAERRAENTKEGLGRVAFDLLEEHFPQQAKSRRRRNSLKVLVVGVVIGVLLRHLADR